MRKKEKKYKPVQTNTQSSNRHFDRKKCINITLLVIMFIFFGGIAGFIVWFIYLFVKFFIDLHNGIVAIGDLFSWRFYQNFTPPQNLGVVIFSLQFVSVCVCVCVLSVCQWTTFQPNKCINLDTVFAKWLLTALARTLSKFV